MLRLSNVYKEFAHHKVLNNISLDINPGEFISLLGPSGCGKTTLLRIISGIETATGGKLVFENNDITNVSSQKRPFNMVFQSYALFPHLSVFDNLAFGLKIKKLSSTEIASRINDLLALVGLSQFAERMPDTLSGGQQQRVALARALVMRPKILLLDEPLSALDLKLREQMQLELRTIQKKLKIAFIFVTHDQDEAFSLSDRIAIVNKGSIDHLGTPEEVYTQPKTLFSAQFLGQLVPLSIENKLYIRPENLSHEQINCDSKFSATLSTKVYRGSFVDLVLHNSSSGEFKITKDFHAVQELKQGSTINFYYKTDRLLHFKDSH